MKSLCSVAFLLVSGIFGLTPVARADNSPAEGKYGGAIHSTSATVGVSFKLTDQLLSDKLKGEVNVSYDNRDNPTKVIKFTAHFDPQANQIVFGNISDPHTQLSAQFTKKSKRFVITVTYFGAELGGPIVCRTLSSTPSIAGKWVVHDGTVYSIVHHGGESYTATYHGLLTHSGLLGTLTGTFDGMAFKGKVHITEGSTEANGTFDFTYIEAFTEEGSPKLDGSLSVANNIDEILRTYPTNLTQR